MLEACALPSTTSLSVSRLSHGAMSFALHTLPHLYEEWNVASNVWLYCQAVAPLVLHVSLAAVAISALFACLLQA